MATREEGAGVIVIRGGGIRDDAGGKWVERVWRRVWRRVVKEAEHQD